MKNENTPELEDDKYTKKIDIPQYQITGECPKLAELVDSTKTKQLIAEIDKSNCDDNLKQFLTYAAYRHLTFDYSKIAEYYAHADKEVQELMEKSALVIIDFDDAIKNGYVQLTQQIMNMYEEDNGDDEN